MIFVVCFSLQMIFVMCYSLQMIFVVCYSLQMIFVMCYSLQMIFVVCFSLQMIFVMCYSLQMIFVVCYSLQMIFVVCYSLQMIFVWLWYIIGQAAVYVYFITINIIKLYIRFHVDIRHGQSEIFRINEIPLFSCMLPFKYVCIKRLLRKIWTLQMKINTCSKPLYK
jgi:hypothetical protein